MRSVRAASLALALMTASTTATAITRTVGPGRMHATIAAAAAASMDGDTIEIAAGTYREEVVWSRDRLTIRGVGGRVALDRAGMPLAAQGGKGIFVLDGADVTVEDLEFQGAVATSGRNGAGIRWQGTGSLTVRRCVFRDNENGILGGNHATNTALIEASEFVGNGRGDLGYTHNIYIGAIDTLTFRGNWSHALYSDGADVGHLLKSRARTNVILANRLTAEGGFSSYEIQLTGGGVGYVIGNVIHQGSRSRNSTLLSFGGDGTQHSPGRIYVGNNTLVNELGRGTFITVVNRPDLAVRIVNNLFVGGGTLVTGGIPAMSNNGTAAMPGLRDVATYDYRLTEGSSAINAGIDPGTDGTVSLRPALQYVHPRGLEARPVEGSLDLGAYEFAPPARDGGSLSPDAASLDGAARPEDATVPDDAAAREDGSVPPAMDGSTAPPDATMTSGDATSAQRPPGCACRAIPSMSPHGGLRVALFALAALASIRARPRRGAPARP
jgi:hypothetical protein